MHTVLRRHTIAGQLLALPLLPLTHASTSSCRFSVAGSPSLDRSRHLLMAVVACCHCRSRTSRLDSSSCSVCCGVQRDGEGVVGLKSISVAEEECEGAGQHKGPSMWH